MQGVSSVNQIPFSPIIDFAISPEDINHIATAAYRGMNSARRSRRRYHPPGTVGTRQYQDVHHELAHRLLSTARWRLNVEEGYVTLRLVSGPYALAIASGAFGATWAAPLVFDRIEDDTHRERAVKDTGRVLSARNLPLFPGLTREEQPPITTIFLVLAQDPHRMRADLQVGDHVIAGRLQPVECRPLFHREGRPAKPDTAPTSDLKLPLAVPIDVPVEWIQFPRRLGDDKATG